MEKRAASLMQADEVLALGRTTLSAAFDNPTENMSEGDDLLTKAFRLRDLSFELGARPPDIHPHEVHYTAGP